MSYKITIEKITTEKKMTGREWKKLSTKEIPRIEEFMSHRNNDDSPTRIDDVMGYTPEHETEEEVVTQVFEQIVDDMDMKSVIKAINGMPDESKSAS